MQHFSCKRSSFLKQVNIEFAIGECVSSNASSKGFDGSD